MGGRTDGDAICRLVVEGRLNGVEDVWRWCGVEFRDPVCRSMLFACVCRSMLYVRERAHAFSHTCDMQRL